MKKFSVTMPDELADFITEEAWVRRMSRSSLISELVAEFIKQQEGGET